MEQFRHILAGWLLDGSGSPVRRGIVLRLSKGIVVSLEEAGFDRFERGEVEDLSNCTILPGLADAHVHLAMSGTEDAGAREAQRNASFERSEGLIRTHLQAHIRHGVVALRDGGDGGGRALLYKERFLSGTASPVAVKVAGKGRHAAGRYGSLIGECPRTGERLAEAVARAGGDHVKIVNSGLNSLSRFGAETAPQFSLDELREAVERAHALGRKVMVHANGRVPVRLAVEAGCDSIEHGFFMGRENLERMAGRETVWVPTAFPMAAYAEKLPKGGRESEIAKRNLDHQLDQIRRARSLGVIVALGTDSGSLGVNHGRAFREELQLLMSAGFRLEEAVKGASAVGAALLGVEDHTEILAPGRPATFVAVKGGPEKLVEGLKSPCLVFVKGEAVSGNRELLSQRHRGSKEEFRQD